MKKICIIIIFSLLIISTIFIVKKEETKSVSSLIDSIPADDIVERLNLNNEIESVLVFEENRYKSYLIENNKFIDINDLIKEDKKEEFNNKIKELLNLKYPLFVVEAILKDNVQAVYHLKENELIIYYYDYEMEPFIEDVYLIVNYNYIYEYMNITLELDSEYLAEDAYDYDKSKKTIALSFDDGPNGDKTEKLITILANNKARATFFMVGSKLEYYKNVVKEVYDSKNEIGYHGYTHTNMKKLSSSKLKEDFSKSDEIYYNITNDHLNLIRPPYGSINTNVKKSLDKSFILWSLDTNDWRYRDSEYLYNYVLDNVKDGDIILFHDSYDSSVEAIEKILPYLYKEGYQVVTVSTLAILKGKTLEANKTYRFISS